jgi:quinol monooxygenase YgiN
VEDSARQEFNTKLEEVFSHIVKEPTFIDASFLQDKLDPQNLVVHEEWFESPDSFMRNQMKKTYRARLRKDGCRSKDRAHARLVFHHP